MKQIRIPLYLALTASLGGILMVLAYFRCLYFNDPVSLVWFKPAFISCIILMFLMAYGGMFYDIWARNKEIDRENREEWRKQSGKGEADFR